MSLQIIYGRSGCGKTQYIFNEISKNIDNGRKKYIITPEQFSFSAEKELLRSLEDEEQNSAVINAEVLTFARMAHRVSSEVGGSNKTVLSNCGKSMLIYSILSNKKNKPNKYLQIETSDKIFLSFLRSFAPTSNHIMPLIPIFAKQIDAIIIYTQT